MTFNVQKMPGEKDNAKMIRDVFRMLLSLKDSGV